MNRAEQNLLRKHEAADRRRIAAAAEKICADPDLRFWLACCLEELGLVGSAGMAVNPFTTNALTTAHETGKMAAMQRVIDSLTDHEPAIYLDLIKELLHERSSRTAELARAAASGNE